MDRTLLDALLEDAEEHEAAGRLMQAANARAAVENLRMMPPWDGSVLLQREQEDDRWHEEVDALTYLAKRVPVPDLSASAVQPEVVDAPIPCCDFRDHEPGWCLCQQHPPSTMHPFGMS